MYKGTSCCVFHCADYISNSQKKVAYEGTLPLNPCLSSARPSTTNGYLSIQPFMYPESHTHTHTHTPSHTLRLAPLVTQGPGRHQSIMTLPGREVKNWIIESFEEVLHCLLGVTVQRQARSKRGICNLWNKYLPASYSWLVSGTVFLLI